MNNNVDGNINRMNNTNTTNYNNYNPNYRMMNPNAMALFLQNAFQNQNIQQQNNPYQTIANSKYPSNINPSNVYNPSNIYNRNIIAPFTNFYNPLIVQNYYAMCNNQNRINPVNSRNCYATPYTMNTGYKSDKQSNKVHYNLSNFESKNKINNNSKEDDDEITKWIESRKRNFPCKNRDKSIENEKLEQTGMMSQLERKLREKIKVMSFIDKKGYQMKNKRKKNNRRRRKNKHIKTTEPEDGEICENQVNIQNENHCIKETSTENTIILNEKIHNKAKIKCKIGFRYKKSLLYENLIKSEKIKELNIILQTFRYFINEGLV